MDDKADRPQATGRNEVFMLVRIVDGERRPYVPFSGSCACGCGGVPGSCCCSAS